MGRLWHRLPGNDAPARRAAQRALVAVKRPREEAGAATRLQPIRSVKTDCEFRKYGRNAATLFALIK
jgi:hypothetical protein